MGMGSGVEDAAGTDSTASSFAVSTVGADLLSSGRLIEAATAATVTAAGATEAAFKGEATGGG